MDQRTLGEVIRDARMKKNFRLRQLAERLEIAPSYLSDIENDRRVPAEEVLEKIASVLSLDIQELMGLAGRFGEAVERYLKRQPSAGVLFRRISESNLGEADLRKLLEEVRDLTKKKEKDR